MPHESTSLDALGAFLRVAQYQSFSRASRALHVTPSAVSHRIAELESQLGVDLFVRTTRSVRLTPAGKDLARSVEVGLGHIQEGLARVRQGSVESALTVSCSTSFAMRFLLPRLAKFRQERPTLEVHVAADDRLADPRRDDIDICIRYGGGRYPGLSVERLGTQWVFPVCSPEYKRRHKLREPLQLSRLSLVHHDVLGEHPGRVDWSRWLERVGLDAAVARRGTHYSHAHMALSAAVAGEGVALGRTSLVQDDLARGHLVVPFGPRVRSGLAYFLVSSGAPKGNAATFAAWLRSSMKTPMRP
jgi:LysR family glycine cleavage system transcriptional activator